MVAEEGEDVGSLLVVFRDGGSALGVMEDLTRLAQDRLRT